MSAALCREFGAEGVAFPLPAELAVLSEQELKERAGVGYRAGRIIDLAQTAWAYDCAIEAWDTETVRLMKELGLRGTKPGDFYAAARLRYAPYAPFSSSRTGWSCGRNYEGRSGLPSTRWQRHTFQSSL
eukprot:jgi/Tetstr1/466918/TSEL_011372.t1